MSRSTAATRKTTQTTVPAKVECGSEIVAGVAIGGVKTSFRAAPSSDGTRVAAFAAAAGLVAAFAFAAALAFAAAAAATFAFSAACTELEPVGFAAVDDPPIELRLEADPPADADGAGCEEGGAGTDGEGAPEEDGCEGV
jgi:hypothetical protein